MTAKRRQKTIKIESAKYIGKYMIHFYFSDGVEQVVNFGPFLENSRHPEIRSFLSPKKFRQFSIQSGELMWGDFDLIFPIMDIYQNNLSQLKVV